MKKYPLFRNYSCFLLLPLVLPLTGKGFPPALENFVEGYALEKTSDTIFGKVNFLEWSYHPEKITFISKSGVVSEYTPEQITGFGVFSATVQEHYISYNGKIVLLPDKNLPMDATPELEYVETSAFLRRLEHGTACLYLLNDKNGNAHYFISKDTLQVRELEINIYSETRGFTPYRITQDLYKRQLAGYFYDCPETLSQVGKLSYTTKAMIQIFRKYNLCNTPEKKGSNDAEKNNYPGIGPLVGTSLNSIRYREESPEYLRENQFDPSFGYQIGLFTSLTSARDLGKNQIYMELIYKTFRFENEGAGLKLEADYLIFSIMFRRTFLTGKIAPYGSAGFNFGKQLREEVEFVFTRPYMEGFHVGLNLATGIRYNRFFGEIRYENKEILAILENDVITQSIGLTLGYSIF